MGTRALPSGTVTFLFTDVEGSTKLLHALGADAYADALATHRRQLREAFGRHGGVEVDTQGDAFFVAFPTAPGALAAALEATEALGDGPIRVRIGLHTGTPVLTDEGYVGADVHKGARIAAAGHGGQVLVSAATAALLDGSVLCDLGAHRLKDLTAPERIFQADAGTHPPLKTLHQTNLPIPATPFLGRETQLAEVTALLAREDVRVLTLTGPGGTGKTRLALQAAADVADRFADGVWWVPLAALRDADLVLPTAATTLGVTGDLAEQIGDRRLLLVLDNFEQVVAAAPALSGVASRCPHVRVLVTSREPLEIGDERLYRVPALESAEAVALFVARSSTDADPHVEELCRRLDNLPLAVELAAARARHVTPRQMLDRISARLDLFRGRRDADPRHATLRATIDWSYRLLSDPEQRLFARLAVFRGGWTLDAAEAVADADLDELAGLVDKSLVVRAGERYSMLETIREFAEERLDESADADRMRERHVRFFVGVVERWYEDRHAGPTRWFPEVDAEIDNVRQAIGAAARRDGPEEQRVAGAIALFWALRGYGDEALARLAAAVERRTVPDRWRARALMELGAHLDDVDRIRTAMKLWAAIGDRTGEADALESLGWAYDAAGDYGAAEAAHEASLAIRDELGNADVEGLGARAGLCHVLVAQADTSGARRNAEKLLVEARAAGNGHREQLALHFLADCALVEGRYHDAETAYLRALEFAARAGLVARATDEVQGIAMAYAGQGRHRDALRLFAGARAKQIEIGQTSDAWWKSMHHRLIGAARDALAPADVELAEVEAATVGFEPTVRELLSSQVVPR